jgi:hypothetical protein
MFHLVVSSVLGRFPEHHTLSRAIGQTLILLAGVAVLEEMVFGILRLVVVSLWWIFWTTKWILVCLLVYFGKRLLLVALVPQED